MEAAADLVVDSALPHLEFQEAGAREIVIVTPRSRSEADPFLAVLHRTFLPNSVLVATTEGSAASAIARVAPLVEGKLAIGGKAAAYVCTGGACKLPTVSPAAFEKQLRPLP